MSFFEKLKRGMGVETSEMEEKEAKEPKETPKPSKALAASFAEVLSATKAQSADKKVFKNKVRKIEVKKSKAEPRKVQKKEIVQEGETGPPRVELLTPAAEKETGVGEPKEKWAERSRQSFDWQNLGGQEGELAIDVYQTDSEIVIQSAIAGVKPETLDISIENDKVLIRGQRAKPSGDSEKKYFYQECYWGPFSREIILPEETDPSRAGAVMKEGILIIRIPRIERQKKRKIEVKE